MMQVARLAPNLLHEAAERVAAFLAGELNADGGGRDRAGQSDLYYTAFVLDGLIALQSELPRERVLTYVESFGSGESLDLVHRACLARAWAALDGPPDPEVRAGILQGLARHRTPDGGFAAEPDASSGTVYGAFLALGAYQDLGAELPQPDRLADCIEQRQGQDGSYADEVDGFFAGTTPTTAAALTLLRHLGREPGEGAARWILERAHPKGGFLAVPGAPLPDLLSTATALHALASLQVSFAPVRERCLDFVDSLWTGRAFCGNWYDDEVDCEYAFYALLALGHLSL